MYFSFLNSKLREQNTELTSIRKELELLRQSIKLKESEWRSEKSTLEVSYKLKSII